MKRHLELLPGPSPYPKDYDYFLIYAHMHIWRMYRGNVG